MIIPAIQYLIRQSPTVVTLVDDRIFPGVIKQGTPMPALDMRVVPRAVEQIIDGDIVMYTQEVIFDCYADSQLTADTVAYGILHSGITKFKGVCQGVNIRGITVVDSPTHSLESIEPGSEQFRYVSSCSVEVMWAFVEG
jgi:hypothetical protein